MDWTAYWICVWMCPGTWSRDTRASPGRWCRALGTSVGPNPGSWDLIWPTNQPRATNPSCVRKRLSTIGLYHKHHGIGGILLDGGGAAQYVHLTSAFCGCSLYWSVGEQEWVFCIYGGETASEYLRGRLLWTTERHRSRVGFSVFLLLHPAAVTAVHKGRVSLTLFWKIWRNCLLSALSRICLSMHLFAFYPQHVSLLTVMFIPHLLIIKTLVTFIQSCDLQHPQRKVNWRPYVYRQIKKGIGWTAKSQMFPIFVVLGSSNILKLPSDSLKMILKMIFLLLSL